MAIGAIIGGGVFGLLKMWGTFANIFGDIRSTLSGEESTEFIEGKGWYEWPMKHIPIFMVIALFGVTAVFLLGGFSAGSAAVFGIVLLSTTFLLGAIAVRVMGETSIEPVSGTSFIVLLLLLSVFLGAQDLLGLTKETAIMLGLVGVTVFGSAITMSGSVIDDYKNSLYIGTRPYHISKGNIVGVIPGTIIGAGIAIYLSIELANGTIDLDAPQANAFATFSIIVANGQGDLMLLGLGFLLGCFVEWATGMGTSFGLGMYLNLGYTLPMLIGGAARDRWERTVLDPKISRSLPKKGMGHQKQRALILLTTFMIALGLTVGEAFFGTLSTVFLTIDNVVADPTSIGWFWLRLGLFLGLFTALAGGCVALPTCWDHRWTRALRGLNVGRDLRIWCVFGLSIVGVSSAGSLLASMDAIPPLLRACWRLQATVLVLVPGFVIQWRGAGRRSVRSTSSDVIWVGWRHRVDSWHCISRSGSHPLTGRALHTVSFSSLPTRCCWSPA